MKDRISLKIRSKALLGLPLTARERSKFLMYIATLDEAIWFLKRESAK